jgi:hypothetical protein
MPARLRIAMIGWGLFAGFWLLVLASRGADELAATLVFVAVAVLMLGWLWRRPGRAALITSLVLGLLHTVEQGAYLIADITAKPFKLGLSGGDFLGLVAGIVIVGGSAAALRSGASGATAQHPGRLGTPTGEEPERGSN